MKAISRVLLLALVTATAPNVVNAAILGTSPSAIATIDTYTQYGGGDVIFTLASSSLATQCPSGFWIRATDEGAKAAITQILAAQHAGSPVVVWADTSISWAGGASAACLVWTIST